ncbi:MAG: hypothetical protein RJA98_605 [Pseudomonadota bacterium]
MNVPVPMTGSPQLPQLPAPLQPAPFAPLSLGVSQEQKVQLLEYWNSIVKRKWPILGLATGVAVLAGVVAYALTPVYQSSATLLIEAGKGKIVSIEEVYGNPAQQREHYQTQLEIIKSREVAERTVKALKLYDNPQFDPRKATPGWRERAMLAMGIGTPKTKSVWTDEELTDVAVKRLMGSLTIDPVRLSQLAKVNIESEDPKLAATLANAVAAQYIEADRDERYQMTQQVSLQLQDRLGSLRQKLTESEKALQAYREEKGLVNLGGSAQAEAGKEVGGLSDQLLQARSRRMALEATYQQAKNSAATQYSNIPAVLRDPVVTDGMRQLGVSRAKLAELSASLGREHFKVKEAEAELAALSTQVNKQSAEVVASLTREYESARSTELSLERALGSARGAVQGVNREEFQLGVLDREYQSNRQLYEMFMSRAKETNLAGDVQAQVARVVDRAVPPELPVRPRKAQIVLVAAVLALFLGAMASLLLDRLDNTIKGGDDAEVRLKHPVLAALPELAKSTRAKMASVFLDEPHSHYAEGIRTARTGVLLSNLDTPHKVLLVTSTLPGEGKTTVAINLALAHAQTKRTLLIDCDMRRSQVAAALSLPPGTKGLTDLVAGHATADECALRFKSTGLSVMSVGTTPPNPLELLLSTRFKATLAALSDEYEMIIIDSPPVELVSEALVLAPMATSVAFVVGAMTTPAPLVRKSLERIQRAGGRILGLVVNKLDFKHAQRYYGEFGSSSYNYGGYGTSPYITNAKGGKASAANEGAAAA